MKQHTTVRIIWLALVCTVILHVQSAPLEDTASQQTTSTDRSSEISTTESDEAKDDVSSTSEAKEVPSVRKRRSYNTILRNQRDIDSDSSSDSSSCEDADKVVRKRSADDDSNNGNEETGEDDDSNDNNSTTDKSSEEEDDGSTEEASDDPADRRRRRNAESDKRVKRQARQDSNEDEDGGFTREAAVVSPIRRRRAPDNREDKDVTTKEPENYDDTTFDPIEDPEAGKVSTGTRRRRRREAATTTVGTLDGSSVIVVAPSNVPVKEIPKALNQTLETLKDRINLFEDQATAGLPTVPTVGVLAGASTKQDKDTIIHTISSAQYIVH